MKWIAGVDEVGRGPLAGPAYAASVSVREDFYGSRGFVSLVRDIKDSKQLSAIQRDAWFKSILGASDEHPISFCFSWAGPRTIDNDGIEKAILSAVKRSLSSSLLGPDTKVLLDGRLKAPERFVDQESIIKGDEKVPLISMASVVAKVKRDAYMKGQALLFPQYGFESNVGYGTARHMEAIKKHGLSSIHRKSFCKRFAA